MLLLSLLLLGIINATTIPLFTPMNWSISETGYIINGTACQTFGPFWQPPCEQNTLVIDPANSRILYDLGSMGKYIVTSTSSYLFGIPFTGSLCFTKYGWNYTMQQNGYNGVTSTAETNSMSWTRYTGLAKDIGACSDDISITIIQHGNIILELDVSQRVPVSDPLGVKTCLLYQGVTIFDISTLDKTSNRDPYFTLPSSCNSPLDFCAGVDVNNPCRNCPTV